MRSLATTVGVLLAVPVGLVGPASVAGGAPQAPCTTQPSTQANVNTDCLSAGNYGETAIAVNPRRQRDIVGAVIYTVRTQVNGHPAVSQLVQPHVSSDGGATWTTDSLDYGSYRSATDPSLAFDHAGVVYLATAASGTANDVLLARSGDGGRTWSTPAPVTGPALDGANAFNDHPQLAAFGHGNLIVTWIHEVFSHGNLVTAPVYDMVSHDGGTTWSAPADISGSAPFCTGRQGGDACDQTFGNAVAVSGTTAVVTFQNTYDEAPDASASLGRDRYMSVVVDPVTGLRLSGPFLVGQEYDGIIEHDYPLNANGVQALHDSQFALDSIGNVAADPSGHKGLHFAVVWYDDRNAPRPVAGNPYQAATDSNIIVSQTYDGGHSWSAPISVADPVGNDQFMPWTVYDSGGRLRIGFFDRSYDPANQKYGYTLATETRPGSLRFKPAQLTTALSDPTRNDLGSQGTVTPAFPSPAAFVGDYTAIAADGPGVVAYWTDLRNSVCQAGQCGFRHDSYFARSPEPAARAG
ncbi:MAG TPA: sialidase family protein [Acidimicrobiales bacterium]|nr:sialidase family protein [Acidimicrobiales bacterium]